MERPALKRLLEDIKTGKVQIVVVYKVDRLTRSVDVLDAYGGPEARWSRNANGGLRRSAPCAFPIRPSRALARVEKRVFTLYRERFRLCRSPRALNCAPIWRITFGPKRMDE